MTSPADKGLAYPRISVKQGASAVRVALQTTQEVLDAVKQVPFAGPAIGAAITVLKAIEAMETNKEDLVSLAKFIQKLALAISDALGGVRIVDVDPKMKRNLEQLTSTFDEITDFVNECGHRGWMNKLVKNKGDASQIKDFTTQLERSLQTFTTSALIDQGLKVNEILERLPSRGDGGTARPASFIMVPIPPSPAYFTGRDSELAQLVSQILGQYPARICIRGPGGIGKSALALTCMHDERVKRIFGDSRYFVPLDSAKGAVDIVRQISLFLGVKGGDLAKAVFGRLQNPMEKIFLTLDNFETPWEENRREAEELLARLAVLPNVTVIVTVRGTDFPGGVRWTQPALAPQRPIGHKAAKELLAQISGCRGSEWDELLKAVDNVPLAVSLLADLARGGEKAGPLLSRWNKEKDKLVLLRRLGHDDRESNVAISIQLSLSSPRLIKQPDAQKLLSVLSLLADGVEREDLSSIFPSSKSQLKVDVLLPTLLHTSLAYELKERERVVIRVLAPIRTFMQSNYPCDAKLLGPLYSYYKSMAGNSHDAWLKRTALLPKLYTQVGNITAILDLAVGSENPISEQSLRRVLNFGRFTYATSLGDTKLLETVAKKRPTGRKRDTTSRDVLLLYAECLLTLAELRRRRSELESATAWYSEALATFQKANDTLGEANCLIGLGSIHFVKSELDLAHNRYGEALVIYRKAKRYAGEGNCLRSMAEIDLRKNELDTAKWKYTEALAAFGKAKDVLGEGNCLNGLANIHLKNALKPGELEEARLRYKEALPKFKEARDLVGEANCLKGLADIHLMTREFRKASEKYKEAQAIFKKTWNVVGEALCLLGFGDIHCYTSNFAAAKISYNQALKLLEAAGDTFNQGIVQKRLNGIV